MGETKQMIKLKDILMERISDIVYHFTTTEAANNIIGTNRFRLTDAPVEPNVDPGRKYEDALKYFLKSAELDPTYALAYSNAAATLVQTSKWDDAEKACKMALECNPNDIHGQLNLAHSYLAKGEWDKGWEYWGKSLGGKFRKEWVYGDEVRWDGTKDNVRKWTRIAPKNRPYQAI